MANYKAIEQVLDLAHRTGDKIIVVSEHHDPYVLMSVKEYEALLHGSSSVNELTEEQLLEKINRDIAVWKASQDDDSTLEGYNLEDFKVSEPVKSEKPLESKVKESDVDDVNAGEEDKYYIEPVD